LGSMINDLQTRIAELENYVNQFGENFNGLAKRCFDEEWKKRLSFIPQAETFFGLLSALVIDTKDVWKQGRIRYYTPLMQKPGVEVKKLPWAYPVSAMGAFDDSGLFWVPPAGSTVSLLFENGSRHSAFYIGTIWTRARPPSWGRQPIKEYDDIHRGHRGGYIIGTDEVDVLPQWNTENYNGVDVTEKSRETIETDPEAWKKLTFPNIYGFKTPQKHMLKLVDGDYNCSHKHKRIELLSSCGNWLLFKDDHMREFKPRGEYQKCDTETKDCDIKTANSPYFKHKNELRPWNGPETPQNNKCELKQSGIQMLSISGHTFFMDDSVEKPKGVDVNSSDDKNENAGGHPGCPWERSMKPFDFGCNDVYKGRFAIISATGHRIELNDEESKSKVRSEYNGIKLLTAAGNKIFLNDHQINETTAGKERGIHMESTSKHTIDLVDEELEQTIPIRQGSKKDGDEKGGKPIAKAKKAYVKIRSGYGLEIKMEDKDSQEETKEQSIQITAPQKDNTDRGPHILRMQEKKDGAGMVFLKVGGNYICMTYDNHTTIVGDKDKNPADRAVFASRHSMIVTEKYYMNSAETHLFKAKKHILLMAGEDCYTGGGDGAKSACMAPVLCFTEKGITISDRVYVSASKDAQCASLFHLTPFHQCESKPDPNAPK